MTNGYDFYFKDGKSVLTFPITPAELSLTVGSTNEVVTLIDEGEINILKSPSLTEIKFDARFPMRKYPYSRSVDTFKQYYDKFKELKEKKKSFRFIVARSTPKGKKTWDTNLLVSLEEFEISENADEGDDVIVKFKLKQYREYGVRILKVPTPTAPKKETTSTSKTTRPTEKKEDTSQTYVVKKGDCLWNIAKKFYGSGSKWKVIYNANKTVIENEAKKHGKKSSSNGHWIYPGCKLTIPGVTSSAVTNSSSSSKSSSSKKTNKKTIKKYTVTVRITNPAQIRGRVRIIYIRDGKSITFTSDSTVSLKVDADTAFKVTFIPSSGYQANKGLTQVGWVVSANSIQIPRVKSNATISVSWGNKK